MGAEAPVDAAEASDLAQLWNEALADFKDKTKLDLSKFQFKSMEEAIASTRQQKEAFNYFRHPDTKVNAVRTAFGNNLALIQKVVNGAKMAADVAGAFPPALPAGAIMTAFTFVFQTFKDIKADYDRVVGFFNEMGSFLDRISMLEEKSPHLGPLDRCLRKVFASMLTLCGIAGDYKSKGRFKKWVHNLKDGSGDPALADAYSTMEDSISKLGEAVGVATLRTAVEIKDMTTKLDTRTEEMLREVSDVKLLTQQTNQGITVIREGVEQLDIRMDGFNTSITSVEATVARVGDSLDGKLDGHQAILVSKLDALLKQSAPREDQDASDGDDKQKGQQASKAKGDAAGKKHRALAQVKRHFADGAEVRKKIKVQRDDITDTLVKDTATWVLKNSQYESWINGEQRVLWLSGAAGTGKTYLAHSIALDVEQNHRAERTSVAHFFFREDSDDLRNFRSALRCAVLQIAENNNSYCETIAAEIGKDADEEPWKQFFADRFPAKSDAHLYLILDGVDEAHDADKAVMAELFSQIMKEQLNIHVLFTSRPELKSLFNDNDSIPPNVEITKDLIVTDMRKLTEARIKTLPRVRKFHRQTRRRIEDRLLRNADGMVYIEHMLRRLSAIGRESAVLKDIEKNLPDSLDALYSLMLAECQKGRTPVQYETLRTLFAMLAFSKRALTLDEASDLIKLTDPDSTFDIEDEVIGRSARILEFGKERGDDDDRAADDEKLGESEEPSAEAEFVDESGKTPLSFQERSLREYFRAINVEEDGLRTPPARAHLIIFELLVTLLCPPLEAKPQDSKEPRLRDYATFFWLHHFVEIDLQGVSDEQFCRALGGLKLILDNENNVAAAFEKHHPKSYADLEKELSYLAKFKAWFEHAAQSPGLESDTKLWAAGLVDAPQKSVLTLALGHVENWFKTQYFNEATWSFWYAKHALVLAGAEVETEWTGKKDIVQVFEYFPDVEKTADAYRATANILQRRQLEDDAIEFCEKGLTMQATSTMSHFRTFWIIALSKWRMGYAENKKAEEEEDGDEEEDKNSGNKAQGGTSEGAAKAKKAESDEEGSDSEGSGDSEEESDDEGSGDEVPEAQKSSEGAGQKEEDEDDEDDDDDQPGPGAPKMEEALRLIDQAFAVLPADWKSDVDLMKCVEGITLLRALCYRELKRPDDALKSYVEHRNVRPDVDTLLGRDLDNETRVKDWEDHASEFFNLLQTWTPKERNTYCEFLFTWDFYDEAESVDNLERYAKAAGKRGIDCLERWYLDYINSLRKGSSKVVTPMWELAILYRTIANDNKKSIDTIDKVLGMEFKHEDLDSLETLLLDMRLELADLLFTEFRAATDPKKKIALYERMKKLPNFRTSAEDGVAQGSEDDWNESQTAVMLALMTRTVASPMEYQQMLEKSFKTCVDGLTDSVGYNDKDSFRLLAKVLACVPGLGRDAQISLSCQFSITDRSVSHGEEDSEEDKKEAENEGESETSSRFLDEQANGSAKRPSTASIQQTPSSSDVIEKTMNVTVEKMNTSKSAANVAGEIAKLADDNTEDLIPEDDRWLWCDGDCDIEYNDWSQQHMYYCVQCANTELCEECYQKRLKMTAGEPNDYWRDWCGPHHVYVKGPIDNWRGVKDGVIRIGDENLPFKEWLRGLREERWAKAWENFWHNEGFLSNVGF